MRATLRLVIPVAGLLLAAPVVTRAQSSQDLLRALELPKGAGGTSRGIRPSPAPADTSAAAPSATPSAPSRPHTRTAASAPPAQAQPGSGEVSMFIEFRTGSAQLSPAAMHALDTLGTALASPSLAGDRFRVEGHTDTVGTPDANKGLSERRAEAVVAYLTEKFHIDRSRLDPVGLGETELLVPTPPQTSEAHNRRVRVVNLGA